MDRMGDALDALVGGFVAGVLADGLEPDARLRILRRGLGVPAAEPLPGPDALGPAHERLLIGPDRTSRGAWYTPTWLAADLVSRAIPGSEVAELGTVLDPACGGGAFLLAAADRLAELGHVPTDAVGRLRGRDLDPDAVAVTEAALWWWSARRGEPVVAGAGLVVDDALTGSGVGDPRPRWSATRRSWGSSGRRPPWTRIVAESCAGGSATPCGPTPISPGCSCSPRWTRWCREDVSCWCSRSRSSRRATRAPFAAPSTSGRASSTRSSTTGEPSMHR